jgi:hypothetical protein
MDEKRLERALREGPQFRTRYIAQSLPADAVAARPAVSSRRPVLILVTTAVLLMLTVTALILAGFLDRDVSGYALVVEITNETAVWEGDAEEYAVRHMVLAPGADEPSELPGLPSTARGVRWSPDGRRMAYLTHVWVPDGGPRAEGIYLADGDGRNPIRVDLPRDASAYNVGDWTIGPVWAPSGRLVAFSAAECLSGQSPDCTAVVDVFDTDGRLIASIPIGASFAQPMWSPDSEWLGWAVYFCEDGPCEETTFHARSIADVGREITVSFGAPAQVTWGTDGRLLVVEHANEFQRPARVYSMAPDRTDFEDVNWQRPLGRGGVEWVAWSPDGGHLALGYAQERPWLVRDVETGLDSTLVLYNRSLATWSPDAKQMVMFGGGQIATAFSIINVDGTGMPIFVGEGTDIAWKPLR